jgi:endonuclease/exonuclease/phosphatase (EEP) superfamily protein YafD
VLLGDSHTSFISSLVLPFLVVLNCIQILFLLIKRSKKALVNLVALLMFFYCFDSFYQYNTTAKPSNSSIKILSFNTYQFKTSARGVDNGERKIVDFVKKQNADIVCFQEFSATKYKLFIDDYPYWVKTNIMMPYKSVLSVFSKYPIIDTGYVEFFDTKNNTMYVDISINGEILRFYNVHLESYKTSTMYQLNNPNSYKPLIERVFEADKIRAEQAQLVKDHVEGFKGKSIIVGDFNSTQYSPVYRILKKGKKDTFTEAGKGFGGTFYLFNYPFKIDHILVDETVEVINHENFNIDLSDHEPILAEIKL